MKAGIREILFNELKKKGVTIYQFSKETGIPKERVYKWEQGKGTPKEEDAQRIRAWIGEKVTTMEEPRQEYAMITMPAEVRINELLADKKVLADTIASNLQTIHASQDVLMMLVRSVYDQTTEIKQMLAAPQKHDTGSKGAPVLTKTAKGTKN